MNFSERLLSRRLSLNLTQEALAERAGLSARSIIAWEKGENVPRISTLSKVAEVLGVTPQWLNGQTEADRSIALKESVHSYRAGTPAPRGKAPVIAWARAGEDGFNYSDFGDAMEEFVETDCRDPNAFALIIEGDSMEPRFMAGDRVIVSPNSEPRNGDYVVARLRESGGVMFKRYRRTGPDGAGVRLESLNEAYSPKEFKLADFRWIYPVVEMTTRFRW